MTGFSLHLVKFNQEANLVINQSQWLPVSFARPFTSSFLKWLPINTTDYFVTGFANDAE